MVINKDTLVGDIIKEKPEAIETLVNFGMGCVGCPSAQMESLEQAASIHGLDLDELLLALNK